MDRPAATVHLRIGQLAELAGVTVRALRYYEERDLLRPQRSPSGQRRYQPSDVDRVILILELYAAGIRTRRIGEILPLLVDPEAGDPQPAVAALLRERRRLRDEVKGKLRCLDVLDEIVERFPTPGSGPSRASTETA